MSQSWNEGYFTDAGYTYGYYRELSPTFQRFMLLVNGFDASLSDAPAHCELGFGQGVSINIHAASNPGDFVGTDFNPSHATYARSLATASGRGARFYDDSFEQLLNRTDLPQFDSISLHGIWTWVSRDNHKIIKDFARKHLKPGGVLYISYNCFPGWSAAAPLRQLFSSFDRFADSVKDPIKRVDAALSYTETLFAAQPAYLKSVVGLEEKLKTILGQNRSYLAHEYFNRDWNCMYFTDVVDILADAKLEFASTASPFDLIDAINLNGLAQEFLKSISHPVLRQQARDYFVNTQFRKDLFMRGATRLHPAEMRTRLLESKFVLTAPPDTVNLKIKGPAGEAQLQEAIYRPLLETLAANGFTPKGMPELLKAGQAEAVDFNRTLQAMVILTGLGVVHPCQPEQHAKAVRKSCDALNLHVLRLGQSSNNVTALASPVTGSGVPVDRISQLFLLAEISKSSDPVQFAWQGLLNTNEVLMKDGVALKGAEANLSDIRERHANFKKVLAIYKALQIV